MMSVSDFLIAYWYYALAVLVTGVLLFRNLFDFSKEGSISATEATTLINRQNAIVIDVRDQESFNKGHITNAIHIPFDELEAKKEMLAKKYKQRPIIVSCDRGNLSGRARIKLIGLLEKNEVYNLNGGIVKWKEDGLPLKMG